jgi:hypothetical protein
VSNSDGITDDVRKREDEYFRRRDRELIEKMRQAESSARTREALESRTGIHDQDSLRELEALGFTIETCALLPLIPLVQVAWAEAGVSAAERQAIMTFARARGIEPGTAADHQLTSWLEQRPSEETFHKATRLISAMIDRHGEAAADLTADELIARCEAIAQASGGVFGLGSVSAPERAVLEEIATGLKKASA